MTQVAVTDVGQHAQLSLTITTRPTTHALSQVIALLHSRGAHIARLGWDTESSAPKATVTLEMTCQRARQHHLRAALERLIDVTHVELSQACQSHSPG